MGFFSRWFGKSRSSDMKISGGPYSSVQEMVDDCGDREAADGFRQYQANRVLIRALVVGRGNAGITEDEMSARTGWNLDDLLDFEAQEDGEISLRDLVAYSSALRIVVDFQFRPNGDDPSGIAAVEGINQVVRGRGA